MPARTTTTRKRDPYDLSGLRVALYCRVSLDKTGEEKSVEDQEQAGRAWAERVGAVVVRDGEHQSFRDVSLSASAFAKKDRPAFDRVYARVGSGDLDLVWLWDQNRLARRTKVVGEFIELCRQHGVRWVVRDTIRDPNNATDAMFAEIMGAIDAAYSARLSADVTRGMTSSALKGRPHGMAPFGYRRVYDPATRVFVRDEPDVVDGDGPGFLADSPAYVVREIFARIAAGDAMRAIARDLQRRGIPTSRRRNKRAPEWRDYLVRSIALNPAYIGRRVHQGTILEGVTPLWPPLVDVEVFETVQAILADPSRRTAPLRRCRAKTLLTNLARCAECGGPLIAGRVGKTGLAGEPGRYYSCKYRRCVGILRQTLDEYVEDRIVAWLADRDVYAELTRGDDSAAAKQAREDAATLRLDLGEYRQQARAGRISAGFYAEIEQDRLQRIAEAEQRERAATLPPSLAGVIGDDAAERYWRLTLDQKRQLIRDVADVRVRRDPRGKRGGLSKAEISARYRARKRGEAVPARPTGRRPSSAAERVVGRWLLGDGADWPAYGPDGDGDA